jgi:hypothetical protein
VLDVAQEDGARADQQHALSREPAAVRVEEVRGAVQGDRGFSGAGTAGDDQHPGHIGADRFVLFGLDGCDDVAHATRAVAFERREQRALAGDVETFVGDCFGVEDFVVETDDVAALAGDQVAAAHDVHRGNRGGSVKRFGHRRPPVDDERGVLLIFDGQPTHVPAGAPFAVGRLHVEAPEDERRIADVEVREPPLGDVPCDVALKPGLVGAARPDV